MGFFYSCLSNAKPRQVEKRIAKLQQETGKTFGSATDPLLVSVRSGAAVSMPGMMETILNLGMNDESLEGLAGVSGSRRFALDAYRRFIMMYGATAKGIARRHAEQVQAIDRHNQRVLVESERVRGELFKVVKLDSLENYEASIAPLREKTAR